MKTKILSTVAAVAISLGAITAAGSASARHGHGYGLGADESYYKHGVTSYQYAKICQRLHYNWKVLGNHKARELFFRWNCVKFYSN